MTYINGSKEVVMRSTWEVAYARFLDANNLPWEYESRTFPLKNAGSDTTYTPDFYIPSINEFVEIKGWYSELNKAKMQAFHDTYPSVRVRMIFGDEMNEIFRWLENRDKAAEAIAQSN